MGLPTWAALSVSYFTTMALPELPLAAEVVIAADNDNNKAGIKAAEQPPLCGPHRAAETRTVGAGSAV